jgi:hypothetical protein
MGQNISALGIATHREGHCNVEFVYSAVILIDGHYNGDSVYLALPLIDWAVQCETGVLCDRKNLLIKRGSQLRRKGFIEMKPLGKKCEKEVLSRRNQIHY